VVAAALVARAAVVAWVVQAARVAEATLVAAMQVD